MHFQLNIFIWNEGPNLDIILSHRLNLLSMKSWSRKNALVMIISRLRDAVHVELIYSGSSEWIFGMGLPVLALVVILLYFTYISSMAEYLPTSYKLEFKADGIWISGPVFSFFYVHLAMFVITMRCAYRLQTWQKKSSPGLIEFYFY